MLNLLNESVQFIQSQTTFRPKIGIILGSGLGNFGDEITDKVCIPYSSIPHFKKPTVVGHEGQLIFGKLNGVDIVAMQGRIHFYEGHTMDEVALPTRVLVKLGIKILILTNAAGGVNLNYQPGDLVLIKDHINLMGANPLIGKNIEEFGPRFPDMSKAYNPELNAILKTTADKLGHNLHQGVYAAMSGPTYETPSEIKMVRILGGDMVGMSTVPETIVAHHAGVKVCAISCITNMGSGILDETLSHDHIKDVANKAMRNFTELLNHVIKKFGALV